MKSLLGVCGVFLAVGCGGADPVIPDGGGGGDAGADTGTGADTGGMDTGPITCMMPKVDCKGVCVDTSTDPLNCGGCGVDCSGGVCMNGVCNLLNPDAGPPPKVGDFACIAVDSQYVYVATGLPANNGGLVYKVPVNGGGWSMVANNQANPHGVKSNGTHVYWGNFGAGTIMRAEPTGMNMITVAMNQNQPLNLTLDNTYVFWINNGNGSIGRADLGGGNFMQLFAGYGQNHAGMITNSGPTVYFASQGSNVVAQTPKVGGQTTMIAQNQSGAFGIDTDGTSLFWGNAMGGQIQKVALNNPSTPMSIATGQQNPRGVATDGKNVYWANAAMAGTIQRISVNGGNMPTPLASNQLWPHCVAVDGTSVYWINEGAGTISKTAK